MTHKGGEESAGLIMTKSRDLASWRSRPGRDRNRARQARARQNSYHDLASALSPYASTRIGAYSGLGKGRQKFDFTQPDKEKET